MSIVCYDSDNNVFKELYQWDINQKMVVSGVTEPNAVFHFCNRLSNEAIVVTPTATDVEGSTTLEVDIPNILLQQDDHISVYLCKRTPGNGFRTIYTIRIPVIPRPKPSDYEYSDNIINVD